MLVIPSDPVRTASNLRDIEAAAGAIGLQIQVLKASTIGEIDTAFATLAQDRADALFVTPESFFNSRRVQLAILAARQNVSRSLRAARFRRGRGADELRD